MRCRPFLPSFRLFARAKRLNMQTQPRSLLLPLSTPLLDALRAVNINIDNSAADTCSTFINLPSISSRYLFSPLSHPPFLHSRRHFTVRHLTVILS
jgi:hypothetical protein